MKRKNQNYTSKAAETSPQKIQTRKKEPIKQAAATSPSNKQGPRDLTKRRETRKKKDISLFGSKNLGESGKGNTGHTHETTS
ncbi:hypothetical protein V6N13_083393 [Hibiscus sabdariffa]|uniref:Uncharacterized protein n=1 Tax=Hibiscus sabdariffa TaxID=183260 RepID=A0ABR2SXW4_9ROSI